MASSPPDDSPSTREPTAAEKAATLWAIRSDAGLTSEQENEFQRWLAEDVRHAELFKKFDGAYAMFDRLRIAGDPGTAPANVLPFRSPRPSFFRSHRSYVALSAAAAVIAAGYFGWYRPTHFQETVVTSIGAWEKTELPDGSVIDMNTDSVVNVAFSAIERRIQLKRGEAHFTVVKNPTRPFIVQVQGVSVQAVGTAFNVRLRPEGVEVLVTHGQVRVDDAQSGNSLLLQPTPAASAQDAIDPAPPAEHVLNAGQRVRVAPPEIAAAAATPAVAAITTVPSEEIQRELAWQHRQLEFDLAPLSEIVREFNRYNRHQLVIADPRLADQRFGGVFPAADPVRFVQKLQENFAVIAEESPFQTVLKLPPEKF